MTLSFLDVRLGFLSAFCSLTFVFANVKQDNVLCAKFSCAARFGNGWRTDCCRNVYLFIYSCIFVDMSENASSETTTVMDGKSQLR